MKLYLLFMLINLVNDGKVKTAKQIADKLEITERSVLRYAAELEIMGVPITRIRGRKGGFVIAEKYSCDFNILTVPQREYLTQLLLHNKDELSKQILSLLHFSA